jgi:hypothetical protein
MKKSITKKDADSNKPFTKKDKDKIKSLIEKDKYTEAWHLLSQLMQISASRSALDKFVEWQNQRTKDETNLALTALQYEDKYFKDMTFQQFEKASGEVELDEIRVQSEIAAAPISVDQWIFTIKEDVGEYCLGQSDNKLKEIAIAHKSQNESIILLHDMIHAYEVMLPQHETYVLTVFLFKKLSNKIPNLMKKICVDSHTAYRVHSVLFLLKSFDLDLRLKKPIGTVYGYGREEVF